MIDEECPLTANPCRHCSSEHTYRPYTKLEKDPRSGLFKPTGIGKMEIFLGHYCNNVCCWCDQLESCPIPDNLIMQKDMIEENKLVEEKERVKEERRKAREKAKRVAVENVVVKPTKRLTKVTKPKSPKKKSVTKGVTKRKL
jgi:hypothetical protein